MSQTYKMEEWGERWRVNGPHLYREYGIKQNAEMVQEAVNHVHTALLAQRDELATALRVLQSRNGGCWCDVMYWVSGRSGHSD